MIDSGILKGTLKILVMNVIDDKENIHGYGIRKEVEKRTEGKVLITEGALYPLLHKLDSQGLISSQNEQNGERERKMYSLTSQGQLQLEDLNLQLLEFSGTVIKFLNSKPSLF